MTTVFIAILWCCVQNRLDWQTDTKTALVEMMGFNPDGEEFMSKRNMTFLPNVVDQCAWDEDRFSQLPRSVQRYFHRAFLFTGEPEQFWEDCVKMIRSVTITEEGEILMMNGKWVPYVAKRYFSASPLHAGYVWDAKIRYPVALQLPFDIDVYVRDSFSNGQEDKIARMFGAIPFLNSVARGPAQSARLRWLAYAPVFPTSLLPHEAVGVHWTRENKKGFWPFQEMIRNEATADFIDPQGHSSKVNVKFDSNGLIEHIAAVEENWHFRMSEYKNVGQGILLPSHIESGKQEKNGNFVPHIKVSIKDVEYTYF